MRIRLAAYAKRLISFALLAGLHPVQLIWMFISSSYLNQRGHRNNEIQWPDLQQGCLLFHAHAEKITERNWVVTASACSVLISCFVAMKSSEFFKVGAAAVNWFHSAGVWSGIGCEGAATSLWTQSEVNLTKCNWWCEKSSDAPLSCLCVFNAHEVSSSAWMDFNPQCLNKNLFTVKKKDF